MTAEIDTAMVLAAGLGRRMHPLTDTMPKPMVPLAERPLIDHTLDRLAETGIERAVVNVHYKAEVLEAHIAERQAAGLGPLIRISDERGLLLETGGGVVKALPLLGEQPFLICNSDTTWVEAGVRNLERVIAGWDGAEMDSLMLLAKKDRSLGYSGDGDFHISSDGRLTRRRAGETSPYVFTGVSIACPGMFTDVPQDRFSLNLVWDRAIASGRLYGTVLDGWWMHIGTPPALLDAERFIAGLEACSE